MPALTKAKMQLYVVMTMVTLWAVALLLTPIIGSKVAAVMTPFMTMTVGWLFTQKATEGNGG